MNNKISIGIVTYNSMSDINKVMRSIRQSSNLSEMKVYVIDNASQDGTADFVEKNYAFAEVVRLPENIGFGQGHNAVLPNLESKYHLIVNPDISFEPETIAKMAEFMDLNDDIVLLSPKVLNDDGNSIFQKDMLI